MSEIQINESLLWKPFSERPEKIAENVLYQEIEADSSSDAGFSFYIRSPAKNALLDNEVLIEYTVTLGGTGFAAGLGADTFGAAAAGRVAEIIALRQCWPMARSIQNLSLTINGVNISHQPSVWLDALNRLCISYEEAASICTMAGGEFDEGFPGAKAYSELGIETTAVPNGQLRAVTNMQIGAATAPNTLSSEAPDSGYWHNEGYQKRVDRLVRQAREEINHNQVVEPFLGGSVTFQVYERIPIGPFYFYDSKDERMAIPNIQTMSLVAQYVSGTNAMLHSVTMSGGAQDVSAFAYSATKPKIHLKWRLTDLAIPAEAIIKAPIMREYRKEVTGPAVAANSVAGAVESTFNFTNINLEGVPDMLLVFFKKSTAEHSDASEHHLNIKSLEVTIGGSSGKLNSMSEGELYAMYLKNTMHHGLRKINFYQWSRYNCVAALKPEDMGVERGPGFNFPLQVSVKAVCRSYWVYPGMWSQAYAAIDAVGGEAYQFTVVAMYNKSLLTLTSSGGAHMSLLKA